MMTDGVLHMVGSRQDSVTISSSQTIIHHPKGHQIGHTTAKMPSNNSNLASLM